jgi:hypothetical protein
MLIRKYEQHFMFVRNAQHKKYKDILTYKFLEIITQIYNMWEFRNKKRNLKIIFSGYMFLHLTNIFIYNANKRDFDGISVASIIMRNISGTCHHKFMYLCHVQAQK